MASSPLDGHVGAIRIWLLDGKTNTEIVGLLGEAFDVDTSEASVRRCIERNESLQSAADERNVKNELKQQAEAASIRDTHDGGVEVTLPAYGEWEDVKYLDIPSVMTRHKLDPEEWEPLEPLANVWQGQKKGGEIINYYQFKLRFKRKAPLKLIFPAKIGQSTFSAPKPVDVSSPILTVIPTDPQAPFLNEPLHELFLRWLRKNQPQQGVIGGDVMDNGYISRHRDDPAWHKTVQECIDTATCMLEDYRSAFEPTTWKLIKGNHDDRIRNEQLERNERLYGIRPGMLLDEDPREPVYSLNNLLRLNDLDIEYVEPLGTYEFEQVPITDILAVRHGHKTVKGGALKTADELGHSVVLGHTHRQSITRKTVWNSITQRWRVITAIEAGVMAEIIGGLGYANGGCPDWQPGFATVTTWPDGGFSFDLAVFEQDGILRWRDQVFSL